LNNDHKEWELSREAGTWVIRDFLKDVGAVTKRESDLINVQFSSDEN